MQIAVYPGSFNPLHIGHLAILQYLEEHFDKVLLVVSPQNPLKGFDTSGSARKRLEDAAEALAGHPELHAECCDIEFSLGEPSYTYKTMAALRAKYPEDVLTLVIGADNLDNFDKWRNYKDILLNFPLLVYPRKGYDAYTAKAKLTEAEPASRIELADMPVVDISSTTIREMLQRGEDASSLMI